MNMMRTMKMALLVDDLKAAKVVKITAEAKMDPKARIKRMAAPPRTTTLPTLT